MFANPKQDFDGFDYLEGNPDMSIATSRYIHLDGLVHSNDYELLIAAKDPLSNAWTKWKPFFGTDSFSNKDLRAAYDLHRSVLKNEIVAESDYPTYEENYEAIRILGPVLENKGFIPHYYYSGSKSIHMHIFFDWTCLYECDMVSQNKIIDMFRYASAFKKKFMEWLRTKIISCWDMRCREFDEELIRSSHLIRCEMSKNKFGYKTFLGYSYKDVSFIPRICNEKNRIYPDLGEIKLSRPHSPQELIDEFLQELDVKKRIKKVKNREASLSQWIDPVSNTELRPEVKFILSDEFKNAGDGFKRGMFILANELKRVYGDQQAVIVLNDWNTRMGNPIRDNEIQYRLTSKTYTLSTESIKELLSSLGFTNISLNRNHKI